MHFLRGGFICTPKWPTVYVPSVIADGNVSRRSHLRIMNFWKVY